MCRATGVPIAYILNRGQQIKVMSLILRFCKGEGFVVPTAKDATKMQEVEKYKGAVVIEPSPGLYTQPTYTLDFSSLYPSIMLACNMSYDTLVPNEALMAALGLAAKDVYTLPTDRGFVRFVKQSVREGVLSNVLRALLRKRGEAKAMMKKYEGTALEKQYNLRQNAMKLSSNSVYGFTGAVVGQLPCVDISSSVTFWGRQSIELTALMTTNPYAEPPRLPCELEVQYHMRVGTPKSDLEKQPGESEAMFKERSDRLAKEYVRNRQPESIEQWKWRHEQAIASYPIPRIPDEVVEEHKNRIGETINFIYGDTDSIMVNHMKSTGAGDTIELGKSFAKWISRWFFLAPMTILFEKMYVLEVISPLRISDISRYAPFLLVSKKRYAGLKWERATDNPKKDTKGMESVRRDNSLLASRLVDKMIDTVLKEQSLVKLVHLIKDTIQKLLLEEVDMASLVISKSLQKEAIDYKPRPAHAQLAIKMQKRDPNSAPRLGDRVQYIMVARGSKSVKTGEKAEDPVWAIEHGSPIDINYYLMQQLYNPCERVIEPLMPGITAILFSTHSNTTVYVPMSTSAVAKRNAAARKSTGSSEVVKGMADIEDTPLPVGAVADGGVAQQSTAQQFKGQEAKAKKYHKNITPGQKDLFGNLLRPASDRMPDKLLSTKVKELPILPGQRDTQGKFIREPEYKITDRRPDCTAVHIKYTLNTARATNSAGSIGKYGYTLPKCHECNSPMRVESLSEEDLEASTVAPVCVSCRARWTEQGKDPAKELVARAGARRARAEQLKLACDEKWNACLTCRGVQTVEELPKCGARECNNFFPRISAKVALLRALHELERYEGISAA